MTNIFELFNMVDSNEKERQDKENQKKQAEAEKKAKQQEELQKKVDAANAVYGPKEAPKAPASKKEAADAFKPDEETVIRFMGDSLPVVDFFSPEELAEGLLVKKKDQDPVRQPLTGEMLRARMEKEYPELVKNHTDVVFLKKKNIIVIVMKAKPKGAPNQDRNHFRSSLYPLPFTLLQQFIAIAKEYGEHSLEVHGDIYYMTNTQQYVLDIPSQRVEKYQVEVTETIFDLADRFSDGMKLLEIHSHHTMPPAPSSLDNQSERSPGMCYAIIGHTQKFFPDMTARMFVNEEIGHESLNLADLFETPFSELPEYDLHKIEVVK